MSIHQLFRQLASSLVDSIPLIANSRCFTPSRYLRSVRGISTAGFQQLEASKGDRERVVILGSGWAGYGLSRKLCPAKYQTLVISPRSYFVFTPLLASTSVGTLEFRTALEPVRSRYKPNVEFIQGWANNVDFAQKTVTVEANVVDDRLAIFSAEDRYGEHGAGGQKVEKGKKRRREKSFEVGYDKLVVGVGCYSQTFGTKGVIDNAYFLKDVGGARKIRKRILKCFEVASLPTTTEDMRRQLLNFAIVGGGPTGMEFSAELSDIVSEDFVKLYPTLTPLVNITVYDVSSNVLSMFDQSLAAYAMETFRRKDIKIRTSHQVLELRLGLPGKRPDEPSYDCCTLVTRQEGEVGVGMCVWSTGNMMNPFIKNALDTVYRFPTASANIVGDTAREKVGQEDEWMIEKHPRTGAIVVDDHLRVQLHTKPRSDQTKGSDEPTPPSSRAIMTDVFALGDNASMANATLPVTAQTANQQALWLGKHLNRGDIATQTFSFKNMGIMAYLGGNKGLLQTGDGGKIKGRTAWLMWRGAYLTMSVSWRNKVLIPTYWFLNWAFGRDITRF